MCLEGSSKWTTKAKAKDIKVKHNNTALRVVVPVTTKPPSMVKFYALVRVNSEGLWETMVVKAEEVFFFSEIADTTIKTLNERKEAWMETIKQHASIETGESRTSKHSTTSANKINSIIPVSANLNLANKLALARLVFSISGDSEALKRVQQAAKRYDPDLEHAPPPNMSLHKFLDISTNFLSLVWPRRSLIFRGNDGDHGGENDIAPKLPEVYSGQSCGHKSSKA